MVVEFVLVQQATCKLENKRWKLVELGRQTESISCIHEFYDTWWNVIYYLSKSIIENHVKYNRHTYRFSITSYSFTRPSDCTTRLCLAKVSWQAKAYLPLRPPLIHVLRKGPSYCTTGIGLAEGSGQASFFFWGGCGLVL